MKKTLFFRKTSISCLYVFVKEVKKAKRHSNRNKIFPQKNTIPKKGILMEILRKMKKHKNTTYFYIYIETCSK